MSQEVKTISFRLIISWIFSVLFLLDAVGNITKPVESILFAFLGLLLLSPLNKEIQKRYKIRLSGGLKTFIVIIVFILVVVINFNQNNDRQTSTDAANTTPQLQLMGKSATRDYDYLTVSGEVKNISNGSMKDVEAIASFYDKDGNFITSSDALIDYNPILPGQTSPFKVMQTYNPAITNWKVTFKYLIGGEIPYMQQGTN